MKKLPLFFLLLSIATFSRGQDLFVFNGNEVTYKNNHFHLERSGKVDTIGLIDPITEKETLKFIDELRPVTINGNKIYNPEDVNIPAFAQSPQLGFDDYLIQAIKNCKAGWIDEGSMRIHLKYVILDEKGKVVYYDFGGLKVRTKDGSVRTLNFENAMDSILINSPALKPAIRNHQNVPTVVDSKIHDYLFIIKNHKITSCKKTPAVGTDNF